LLLVGAGSHGSISMNNKATALIIFAGIVFTLTAIIDGLSIRKTHSNNVGFMSLVLHVLSGIILVFYFIYEVKLNLEGGHFSLLFIAITGFEILLCGKIITADFTQLKSHKTQNKAL